MLNPAGSIDVRVPAIVWLIPTIQEWLCHLAAFHQNIENAEICREMSRGLDSSKTNCFALLLTGSTLRSGWLNRIRIIARA
jgi:hypothetical protein